MTDVKLIDLRRLSPSIATFPPFGMVAIRGAGRECRDESAAWHIPVAADLRREVGSNRQAPPANLRATTRYCVRICGQRVLRERISPLSRIDARTSPGRRGRSSGNFHMPHISISLLVTRYRSVGVGK